MQHQEAGRQHAEEWTTGMTGSRKKHVAFGFL